MGSKGTAFLPYDGGDDSLSNQTRNPYRSRVLHADSAYTGSAYTGASYGGTWTGVRQVETLQSYSHPVRWLGRSHRNIGGKFVHTKMHVDKFGEALKLYRGGSTWRKWDGVLGTSGFIASLAPAQTDYDSLLAYTSTTAPLKSNLSLDAFGSTAISRVAPTNPLVDLSSSAAELLREGLPQVPTQAGNVGGEYLNVQFGYLPLFGDVTDVIKTARSHDALLRQFERDSGRWIRRSYSFPEEVSSSTTTQANAAPSTYGDGPGGLAELGTRHTTTTTTNRIWFEGAFTYHLPRSGWRRSAAELDYLYGVRPGVDTLWELTGYSWLADYFTNIGDVMKNITAFRQDGLVMPYGYVMCEQLVEREETWTGYLWIGGARVMHTLSSKVIWKTQQRRQANPFGFGLTDGDLSGRQKSILVALGISRM